MEDVQLIQIDEPVLVAVAPVGPSQMPPLLAVEAERVAVQAESPASHLALS
jgi:hypothetical protein